ncbi:MAG: hypothetical protein ACJ72Z_10720, partial [Pyrinomonadaceae bacterium]
VFVAAALLIGEFCCRQFTSINFLDNSRGMFTPNRFGPSYGNTPNFEGISFGDHFKTDENGFRVGLDRSFSAPASDGRPALLVLGDSVGFGPAVPEEKTTAALLRARMPNRQVLNASVIGYGTFDYRNAGIAITSVKPEVNSVIVLFCLNDVADASGRNIQVEMADPDGTQQPEDVFLLRRINDYLRSRSKLYLWLKNLLRDTQMVYFRGALESYQDGGANVESALQPLVELNKYLQSHSIPLEVFIFPNEAQLRTGAPAEFSLPQKLLATEFQNQGIRFADLTPAFLDSGYRSDQLFLYADPMHLSQEGMKVAADAICSHGGECKD